MFKKKQWSLFFDFENGQNVRFDMTAQHKDGDKVISTGIAFIDEKFSGTVSATSSDIFKTIRKPKKAAKSIAYSLAHHVAINYFSGGKKGLADEMVMDCFGLDDDRAIREARRRYGFPDYLKGLINEGLFIYAIGDSLSKSAVFIPDDHTKIKTINQHISYKGTGLAWGGGLDKAIIGDMDISSKMADKSEGGFLRIEH